MSATIALNTNVLVDSDVFVQGMCRMSPSDGEKKSQRTGAYKDKGVCVSMKWQVLA